MKQRNPPAVTIPIRDPRVDPLPGDALRKKYQGQYFESRGYIEREVDEVYAIPGQMPRSKYMRVVYVGDSVCAPEVTLASWRRWAKGSEVTKREGKEATT